MRQFEQVLVPWFTKDHAPANEGPEDDLATNDEVLAALAKHEAAEQKRYGDVRELVQKLYDAEAGRYGEYTKRFDRIDAALKPAEVKK